MEMKNLLAANWAGHSIATTWKIGKRDLFIFIAWVLRQWNFQNVYRRTRVNPSSSVQFENENDVTQCACDRYEQITHQTSS